MVRMLVRVKCRFCGDLCPESKLELHEDVCEKNPENMEGRPLCEFVLSDEELERRKAALPKSVHDVLPDNFWQTLREEIYDKQWADMQTGAKQDEKPALPQPEPTKQKQGIEQWFTSQ